jgi:hypothetical protein
LDAAIEQTFFVHAHPFILADAVTKLNKHLSFNYGLNAGPYAPFGILAGIHAQYKNWQMEALTPHLESLFLPSLTHGEGAFLNLKKYF